MNKIVHTLLLLCSLLTCSPWATANSTTAIRPFYNGSMQDIRDARPGKPFILGLWSLSCSHCREDLALLSSLSQKYPELDVVLIATDMLEESSMATAALSRYPFRKMEHWIFADQFIEKLRYSIDNRWQGELPRTYLYDAAHRNQAISGKLDALQTERWIIEHFRQ